MPDLGERPLDCTVRITVIVVVIIEAIAMVLLLIHLANR